MSGLWLIKRFLRTQENFFIGTKVTKIINIPKIQRIKTSEEIDPELNEKKKIQEFYLRIY